MDKANMAKFSFELDAYSLLKNVMPEEIIANLNKLYKNVKFEIEEFNEISDVLAFFSKTEKRPTYNYLVIAKLNNEWNIIFDDSLMSDGVYAVMYNLNRLFGYEGLTLNYGEDGTVFNYYKGENTRTIYSILDDKWIFFQKGEILDFEDIKYYTKRKISERFNPFILHQYLEKIGVVNVEELLNNSPKLFLAKKIVIKT
jgi:hypothetical protein